MSKIFLKDVFTQSLERGKGVCHSFFRTLLPAASGNSELTPTWLDFGVGLAPSLVPDAFRTMRSRLIFPIYDADGRLTGFGARRIDNGQQPVTGTDAPKYINSPASALFDKSRTLYGIHRAAEAIHRAGFAFVVEGYKDVLAMHTAGHSNTIALCGTALTDGQAEILARYTSTLHLLLDGDAPGRRAAEKIARERADRFTIRLSPIPTGEDPDELFRRLGKAGFRTYLRHLTATGCLCARRLLAYCLRYPTTAPLLERMMNDDDMSFAESDYRDLLHFLALRPGESLSGCTPELQVLAGFLRSLEDVLFPPLPELDPSPTPEAMLRSLLTEYYEEKVIAQARILRNRLHATSATERPALFQRLHHHFRLLSAITRETERTPAVEERWF